MDYADEPYRRLYIRRTVTNKLLGWEGRAVMHEMHYELDRSGVFDFPGGDPVDSVAVATGLPTKVVRVGLKRLFDTETWKLEGSTIVWPNYLEAQTCSRSDRARQQTSRKRRSEAPPKNPQKTDPLSQNVTFGHDLSHAVTSGHTRHEMSPIALHYSDPELSTEERAREAPPRPQPEPSPTGADPPPLVELVELPQGDGTRWKSFPKGWRWSAETEAAARMAGVSAEELQEHVSWWTTHDFARPVNDLEGELQRAIAGIRRHAETDRFKAAQRAKAAEVRPFRARKATVLAQPNCGMTVESLFARPKTAEAAE